MQIEFSQKAYIALNEIADYLYERTVSKKLTVNYIRKMQSYIKETLMIHPEVGRPAEEFGKGVRKLVYQRYSVLYKLYKDHVTILTLYRENIPDV